MSDKFTEVKNISYGARIKNSFAGFFIGFIFFLGSIVFLGFNEYIHVWNLKKIDLIKKNAIEVSYIDRNNDDKLISTNGSIHSNETLLDLYVTVHNALALKRKVEMYQWQEHKSTRNKSGANGSVKQITEYSYKKIWSEEELNSDKFKKREYLNPKFSIESKLISANKAFLGEFKLTQNQLSNMSSFSTITLSEPKNGYIIHDNYYYKGQNPLNPQIGDIRISYSYIPSGVHLSIIGKQKRDNTIDEHVIDDIDVYTQYDGSLSLKEMIDRLTKEDSETNNIFRLGSFIFMFISLNILISPIKIAASYIPFLENIVEYISCGILFIISLIISITTIACAWLIYRPLISITLMSITALIVVLYKKYVTSKKTLMHEQ